MSMPGMFGSRRSLVLLLSVALNLLLLSAIGVHFVRDLSAREGDRGARIVERLADRLPAEDADKLRATYQQRGAELAAMRAASRPLFDDYRAALRTEPFDRAALDRAIDRLAAARAERYRAFGRMIADAAADMTPEGRAALAEPRRRK